MTARQLSFWQAEEECRWDLKPEQAALLARIDATLDRMRARGDNLRAPVVLPSGEQVGYLPLCLKRERLLAGDALIATRWTRAEHLELITSVARYIPEGVSHSSGTAVSKVSKKSNAGLVKKWGMA